MHLFPLTNSRCSFVFFFFFQAEDGIRDLTVTGVQTCALPIYDADQTRDDRDHHALDGPGQEQEEDGDDRQRDRDQADKIALHELAERDLGDRAADLMNGQPGRRLLADERLNAISEAFVELPVEQAEIRENVDRRGPAGRRDEVAGNDPMPEGVVSNSPEVGWSRGNLRRYQEIGVEEVPPATEVADGRETVDPPDPLDPLESIRQATNRAQHRRSEHVLGFDEDDCDR